MQLEIPFDGATYDHAKDYKRLKTQLDIVRDYMLQIEDRWLSLANLSDCLGFPEASISARLRDLRKAKFGGYRVSRYRNEGTWFYRVEEPK